MHDCDVTCLPLCFTVCDFMIYMAGIMHEPKQWYAQFSGTRNSKSQNTRSEKVKSAFYVFVDTAAFYVFVDTAAAKVCVYTKN